MNGNVKMYRFNKSVTDSTMLLRAAAFFLLRSCSRYAIRDALSFRLGWLQSEGGVGGGGVCDCESGACNLFRARTDILCDCDNFYSTARLFLALHRMVKAGAFCSVGYFSLFSQASHFICIKSHQPHSRIPGPLIAPQPTGKQGKPNRK